MAFSAAIDLNWAQSLENMRKLFIRQNTSELNFHQNPSESENFINTWIANATNNKIQDAIPEGTIDDATQLILANAIYLKTKWDEKFEYCGVNHTFHLNDLETVKVEMMQYESKYLRYANVEKLGFHIVEVPFRGRHAAMYFILPHQVAGLEDVVSFSLDADTINDVIENQMQELRVMLRMPKFQFSNDIPLTSVLKEYGIQVNFLTFSWPF